VHVSILNVVTKHHGAVVIICTLCSGGPRLKYRSGA